MGSVFKIENGNYCVEDVKFFNTMELSFYRDAILSFNVPKREHYSSLEEFNKAYIDFMISKIEEVKNIKHTVFVNALKEYDNLLNDVHKLKRYEPETREAFEELIDFSNKDIRRAAIIAFNLSLWFPAVIPVTLLVSAPRVGFDLLQKKKYKKKLEKIAEVKKNVLSHQDVFYEYIDILRTDYHKSNKELDELKRRAMNGENIMPELFEIVSPERVGLDASFLELSEEELGEDNFKLVKKIK